MKKCLSVAGVLIGALSFAQTYCTPEFSSGCDYGDVIDSFQISSASFTHSSTGCSANAYGDYTAQTITLNAGLNYDFSVTHGYGSQYVKIWIDFNNDGTFDGTSELVGSGTSTYDGTTNVTNSIIAIPATAPVGNHRMRVADRYYTEPIPCNLDGYGEAHDYTVSIAAAPSCLAPSGVNVSAVTAFTANLQWTAPPSAPSSGYEYYYSSNFASPTATTAATGSVGAGVVSVPLTNLSATTNYRVWVRSVCSTTEKSAWSLYTSFTTPCAAVVPSYTNDFSVDPSPCWSQASGGTLASGPTDTITNWYSDDFLNSGSNQSMKINLYYQDTVGWLKSNEFNLSAGGYRVKFDYGVTAWGDTVASAMGSDDTLTFAISTNGGSTWTALQTWNASNAPSNTSTQFSLDLTNYNAASTFFAFIGSDGVVNDAEDYDFFIDNFTVEQIVNLATNENSKVEDKIAVYPNPFTDVINIKNSEKVQSVSVADFNGRIVKRFDKVDSALRMAELSSGMYLLILKMKDGSQQTQKVIKK